MPSGRCGGGGEEECERATGREGSDGIGKKNKGIIDISSSLCTRKSFLLNAATSPLLKLLHELKEKKNSISDEALYQTDPIYVHIHHAGVSYRCSNLFFIFFGS